MSQTLSFTPRGNTVALSVTASSSNASVTTTQGASISYLISNPSANPVWFAVTGSVVSGAAAPVAVVATAGSPALGFCIPNGGHRVINGPADAQWAAIALVAGPSLVYITPGDGGAS